VTVNDERKPEKEYFLIGGKDKFMSGWGGAKGGNSYAFWALDKKHRHALVNKLMTWVENRGDIIYIRYLYPNEKLKLNKLTNAAHVSIYEVNPETHPAFD
jgi:hypothetical protein